MCHNAKLNRTPWAVTLAFSICLPLAALADPPPGYYDSVDTTNATTLRATLHAVIDDHQRFPYTSSSTDTWDILNLADEDPNDAGNILDVYRNASYPKISGGTRDYNREHTWPKSPRNCTHRDDRVDCCARSEKMIPKSRSPMLETTTSAARATRVLNDFEF